MKKIVIYKKQSYNSIDNKVFTQLGFTTVFWKPSLKSFIPPNKGKKYFIYWLFYYLRIFKNKDYSSLLVYDGDTLVSSLLIVPAHFKWPFMRENDLQFT